MTQADHLVISRKGQGQAWAQDRLGVPFVPGRTGLAARFDIPRGVGVL